MTRLGFVVRRLVLLAFAVLIVGAGCSSTDRQSDYVSTGLVYGERPPDLDEIQAEFETIRAEFVKAEEAFTLCVRALGFDYQQSVVTMSTPADGSLPSVAEFRRESGYGIVAGGDGLLGVVVSVEGGFVSADESAFFERVYLNNEGGCRDLSYGPDIQELLYFARFDETQPPDLVLADPAFVEAETAWQTCMAKRGYQYSSRSGPFNDIDARLSELDQSSDSERAALERYELDVASADIDCHLQEIEPVIERLIVSRS